MHGRRSSRSHRATTTYHAENIRAETLILHGSFDDRVPVSQAEMFAAAIKRGGAVTSLKLFDCGHNIPLPHRREFLRPLYDRVFA
ncbi:alpha/beta hydrolase family protein [Stappia sp.]|uniref:alpha/beta hydrolase family protein n=1 Tax=Stappia sp. TaxID=1870903 RepID=UPI003D0A9C2B